MAAQDAKNFLDAVDQDPDLQAQVKGSFDQVINTAQQHGYNVSKKDLSDELTRRWGMTNAPSTDDAGPDTCFLW
jgi:predicted ribosomally synthesized peptide with nif11-like leader